MAKANTTTVGFEYDYSVTLKRIEAALDKKHAILKPDTGRDLTIWGKYDLPDKDREQTQAGKVLDQIIKKRTDRLHHACVKKLTSEVGTWWKDHVVKGSDPPVYQVGKGKKDLDKLSKALTQALTDAQVGMTKCTEEVLKKNVKGKWHKRTTKVQSVKHMTMPVVSMAGSTLAVVGTIGTLGLAIPLAVIAVHKAAKDVAAAARFAKGDYRRTATLEKNIASLAAKLKTESQALEAAKNAFASSSSAADKADVKKRQAAIDKRETDAAAMNKLLGVRTASISTLEKMLSKYKKKVYEHYYHAYSTGKKVDKLNAKHAKADLARRKLLTKIQAANSSGVDLDPLMKKYNKLSRSLSALKKQSDETADNIQDEVKRLLDQEAKLADWLDEAAKYKANRSGVVRATKDVLNAFNFAEDLTSLGLGGAGNANNAVFSQQPTWVKTAFTHSDISAAAAVTLDTANELADKAAEYKDGASKYGSKAWNKIAK